MVSRTRVKSRPNSSLWKLGFLETRQAEQRYSYFESKLLYLYDELKKEVVEVCKRFRLIAFVLSGLSWTLLPITFLPSRPLILSGFLCSRRYHNALWFSLLTCCKVDCEPKSEKKSRNKYALLHVSNTVKQEILDLCCRKENKDAYQSCSYALSDKTLRDQLLCSCIAQAEERSIFGLTWRYIQNRLLPWLSIHSSTIP